MIILKLKEEEIETIKEALWFTKQRKEREADAMSKSEYSLYTEEEIEEIRKEAKEAKKLYNKICFLPFL